MKEQLWLKQIRLYMAFCQWANEFDYYPQNSDDIVEDKVFTTANLAITDTKIKISLALPDLIGSLHY